LNDDEFISNISRAKSSARSSSENEDDAVLFMVKTTKIIAHKLILKTNTPILYCFCEGYEKGQHIPIEDDMTPDIFHIILQYVHGGDPQIILNMRMRSATLKRSVLEEKGLLLGGTWLEQITIHRHYHNVTATIFHKHFSTSCYIREESRVCGCPLMSLMHGRVSECIPQRNAR